jgi:hypothetical protein
MPPDRCNALLKCVAPGERVQIEAVEAESGRQALQAQRMPLAVGQLDHDRQIPALALNLTIQTEQNRIRRVSIYL